MAWQWGQARQSVCDLISELRAAGKIVRFAVHPLAERLSRHTNVLLADANMPYDIILEMNEIHDDFPSP